MSGMHYYRSTLEVLPRDGGGLTRGHVVACHNPFPCNECRVQATFICHRFFRTQ